MISRRWASLPVSAMLALSVVLPRPSTAQRAAPAIRSSTELIAAARAGTSRYRSQENAIADGFRRVGADFPAMGEHWVSLQRIMENRFDAAQPSVLTYVRVGGVPALAGVAYTALLEPGQSAPEIPGAHGMWHEHNGSVAEESLPLSHELHAMHGEAAGLDLRLSILHAWVWTTNPAGLHASDNWALPWMRAGLDGGSASPDAATRALALALTDDEYLLVLLQGATNIAATRDALDLSSVVHEATAVLRQHVIETVSHARGGTLSLSERSEVASEWQRLWDTLEREAGHGRVIVRRARLSLEQQEQQRDEAKQHH